MTLFMRGVAFLAVAAIVTIEVFVVATVSFGIAGAASVVALCCCWFVLGAFCEITKREHAAVRNPT